MDLQEELSEHFVLAFKGLSTGDMKGFAGESIPGLFLPDLG